MRVVSARIISFTEVFSPISICNTTLWKIIYFSSYPFSTPLPRFYSTPPFTKTSHEAATLSDYFIPSVPLIFPTTHSFIISYFLCIFSRHRFAFPSLHIHHTPCIISSTCVEQPIPPSTTLQTDQSSSLFLHLWLSVHESRTEPSRICILTTNRAYHMVFPI